MPPPPRQPHATLDLPSRHLKGLKIERLLNLHRRFSLQRTTLKVLDIGAGSGGIAYYFGNHPQLRCEVDAVDTVDNRAVSEGFNYQLVFDTKLPFMDGYFDVVLSNHVIEHVGDEAEQKNHLAEIRRVLHADGIVYFAVPNRWMLIEPHYRLAFLSYLPQKWRSPYLRLAGKGQVYDCRPFAMRSLECLLTESGFRYRNLSIEAMREFFYIEKPHSAWTTLLRWTPDVMLSLLRPLIPTLVYSLEK